jgi:hypothetical protein
MNKSILTMFMIVIVFLVSSNVIASCSKSEILELIRGGFSKSKINDICRAEPEPKCCCEIKFYKWTNNGCFMCDYYHKYSGKVYRWIEASSCTARNGRQNFRYRNKTVKRCVNPQMCGR